MNMTTYTTEAPCFPEIYVLAQPAQTEIRASEQELSVREISHYGKQQFRETGYNTTTFGKIGFTRVEATAQVTDDILLQARLDILCDKLRAKY
jgi:hypothetical protein